MKHKIVSIVLCTLLIFGSVCPLIQTAKAQENEFVVELTDYAINGYYAFSLDNAADVYESERGQFLRMSYKGARYSCFYFSIENLINGNGTYRLEFEARASDNLVTPNCFVGLMKEDLSQPCAWTVAASKQEIEQMETVENGFHKITLDFRIDDYYTNFYKFMKIGYDCTETPSGFLDIDNIRLYKGTELMYDETVNVDDSLGGDFENFSFLMPEQRSYGFTNPGWTADNTYYNLVGYAENEVLCEAENHFLKLYSSEKPDTTITKSVSVSGLKEMGWYKLKVDLKGGADFYSDNIGFRLQTADQQGYHGPETNIAATLVKNNQWTTVEVEFYVPNTSSSPWINLDFWVFLRNNEEQHKSQENYLLVDNIQFYKAQNTIEFGKNLLSDGNIEGFKSSQGRKEVPMLSTDEYAYSRWLISEDFLQSYEAGTKLTTAWESQNYLGTIDLDVPPIFGEVDGYYAMKLVHDGKSVVKTYASATYILHLFDFTVNNCYKISFDYKVEAEDTDVVRFAFVSNDNEDDFMIDLYNSVIGENKTKGVNKNIYTYIVTDNGDGWKHVELVFKPDVGFKTRVNSMRFLLMTNYNEDNQLYIANLGLKEYSNNELKPLVEQQQPTGDQIQGSNDKTQDSSSLLVPGLCAVAIIAIAVVSTTVVMRIRKKEKHE